jgi:hypothetical protein
MRKLLFAVLLSFVCLPARAQTCSMPNEVRSISAISANCKQTPLGWTECKPGSLSKLQADVRWPVSPLPHCPIEYKWSIGHSVNPIVTTEPVLERELPVNVDGAWNISLTAGTETADFRVWVRWGTLQVRFATLSVTEGGSPAQVVLTRSDATPRSTMRYWASSEPAGYVDQVVREVIFEPGQLRKDITIPVIDNDFFLSAKAVADVMFNSEAAGYTLDRDRTGFLIVDDEEAYAIRFLQRAVSVREDAGSFSVDLRRIGGTSEQTRLFDVIALGMWRQVTFAPGETEKRITFPVTDNIAYRGSPTLFEVTCSASGSTIDTIKGQIIDDEPVPHFTPKLIEISETDATRDVPIAITMAPQLGYSTWIEVIPAAGTATASDFTSPNGSIHWPSTQSTQTLSISVTGDGLAENDETFTIELRGPGAVRDTITVRILDDDRPPFGLAFDATALEVDEATAAVEIHRTEAATAPLEATLRVHGRTPALWTIQDIAISFAAGEMRKRVVLPVDDFLYTGLRDATLELEWNGFAGASAELALRDDEAMPSLSVGDASIIEGASATMTRLEFPLTLTGPVGADLLFRVTTQHGSATADDYAALTDAVAVVAAGKTTGSVLVFVRGDDVVEADESFTLQLESCCVYALLANGTATGTIRDDDDEDGNPGGGEPAAYRIEAAETFSEASRWLVADVSRLDTTASAVATVKLSAGADRHFTPVNLRFGRGETKKHVRFYIDDHFRSGDAAALLEVFSNGQVAARRNVQIVDNEGAPVLRLHDAPPIVVAPGDNANGEFRFTISIDPPSSAPIQVTFTAVPALAEYDPMRNVVTIPPHTSRFEVSPQAPRERTLQLELWPQQFGLRPVIARASATGIYIRVQVSEGKVQPYEPSFAAGTKQVVNVALYPGTFENRTVLLRSSHPQIASVPESVVVTPGMTMLPVEITGVAFGEATISMTLPSYYGGATLTAPVSVYEPFAAAAAPERLSLRTGEVRRLTLSTLPALGHTVRAVVEAADSSTVFVDRSVTVAAGGTDIEIYAANEGETEIVITFPEDGGTTLRVPVKVTKGSTTKRRSAR